MNVLVPLASVGGLFVLGLLGAAPGMGWIFGVAVPYLAMGLFLGGLIYRVMSWANSPVPFRVPTTCGQQKSLPWIKQATLDNPHDTATVIGRMALEILFFRSLLRNTKTELRDNGMLAHRASLGLWMGSLLFHWSMLVILLRHLRLLTEPVPFFVTVLQRADGYLLGEVVVPVLYVSSILFVAGLSYLLFRRLTSPQVRYISLASDYFPLFLLLAIGISGLWLRHLNRTDVVSVKELAVGLVTFRPVVKATISPLFYAHFFLVCVLLACFPFSKLVHMGGIFLSPTRNLANNSRAVRHLNPWDYPVEVHTYEEYEDEFRGKMKASGIPVEKG